MSAPAQEAPTVGQLAEEQVRRTVKALRSALDVSIKAMCDRAGISRGTYFSRMNGSTPFTVGEIAELADLFGVDIADIYSGRITVGPTPPTTGGPVTSANGGSLRTGRECATVGGVVLRPLFGQVVPSRSAPEQETAARVSTADLRVAS